MVFKYTDTSHKDRPTSDVVFENADISYERLASGLVFEYANRHFLSTPSKTDFTFFVLSLQTLPKSRLQIWIFQYSYKNNPSKTGRILGTSLYADSFPQRQTEELMFQFIQAVSLKYS